MRLGGVFDVACALTVYGIKFAELTPESLLHYAWECRRHGITFSSRFGRNTFGGLLAWQVLHAMGHFPPGRPQSIRAATIRGRLTVEEMVDRHSIANRKVRQLLIDYLQRRASELDYSALKGLVARLAGTFWAKIEQIAPGQANLRLDPQVYERWRAAIRLREDGKPRGELPVLVESVQSVGR